jgi:hypothetical protein
MSAASGSRPRARRAIAVALALWALPHAAGAQSPAAAPDTAGPPIAVGTRVRLWEHVAPDLSVPVSGTLVRLTPDTVAVRPDGLATPVAVPRPIIARVERSGGPGTGSVATAAAKGAIVGAIGGAVLGAILGDLTKRNAAKIAIVGFGVGGGIGAGLGAARPGEAWQRAALPPPADPRGP